MDTDNLSKKEVLEITNKSGAYEFGRQHGYSYGFRKAQIVVPRLQEVAKAVNDAQEILANYITPDSGIEDSECINNLLSVLDDKNLIQTQKELDEI